MYDKYVYIVKFIINTLSHETPSEYINESTAISI